MQFLVRELRFHMPCGQKTQNRSNIVTDAVKALKNGLNQKIFEKKKEKVKLFLKENGLENLFKAEALFSFLLY